MLVKEKNVHAFPLSFGSRVPLENGVGIWVPQDTSAGGPAWVLYDSRDQDLRIEKEQVPSTLCFDQQGRLGFGEPADDLRPAGRIVVLKDRIVTVVHETGRVIVFDRPC